MSQITLTTVDFNPFEEGKEIDKVVYTNEPQREIWLSCAIGGDDSSLAYNESVSLDLKGKFEPAFFSASLQEVINRHEALRSSVSANGEMLVIYKSMPADLTLQDISRDADQLSILNDFVAAQMQQLFDLENGPLFRFYLHKLNDEHYYFTLVIHHIIGDGWSIGVILEDLSKIYNARIRTEHLVLEEAPQISKYAIEQDRFLRSRDYPAIEQYWLNMYKDSVPVLDLPTDYPRPATRTYKAKRFDQDIPLDLVEKVKVMGARAGSSLVNTLLSAFEVFLYLQTNQRDIVVGLPTAGQSATENFGLVGHCVNLLPLRSSIDPETTFNVYLKKRKTDFFNAYDHQNLTFGQLISKLNITRDKSRIPLVPVIFNIDMGMDEAVAFDQLTFELVSNPRAYETFELFLNATRTKSSFTLEWSYNTQLFKEETIKKMAACFGELLNTLVANPSITPSSLRAKNNTPWLEQVLLWNAKITDYPKESHLFELIERTAARFPEKTAVSYLNLTLTYAELVERSNQLASYLIAQNIKTGDIIGLAADRSIEMLICLLGILKAGAVYLPLDPEYPQERIEYMLADSDAKMLIISRPYSGKFKSNAVEVVIEDAWAAFNDLWQNSPGIPLTSADLAYILYTSGSTGKPKGVQITHRNLVNFLLSMQNKPGMTTTDRLLAITTISFDIAGLELYLPLITGAELILCDTESTKDGRLLLELLTEKEITFMQATPSTWRMMVDSGWTKKLPIKVLCGGEALPKELAELLLQRSDELWNMYGPTETTIWSTIKHITPLDDILTIGKPINNTSIYILNEDQHLLAPGIPGEIFIGGDGVADGYLNQPELTTERFIKDPFNTSEGARLYRTGDLGSFLENGEIRYLGRVDQQVKIRGHRIELGEIESQLVTLTDIQQAVVIAREDVVNNKRLAAYVVLAENELEDTSPSWKDRWHTLYDMGQDADQSNVEQRIDNQFLDQLENSELLQQQTTEWLQASVARIKELDPQHVLEIGSGGGQMMFELAPYVKSYIATDYAENAIEKLNQKIKGIEKWSHVSASARAANDFSGINTTFDLILIHSVAQYFPDTAYFLNVIDESVKRITDGGCLFIGDMQGKNSLEMYHANDHLSHAKNSSSVREFREVVLNRVRIEDEYVADPAFFYLLPKYIPAITGVDVQLRQGQSQNETTKYHYDVWLYVNSSHEILTSAEKQDWSQIQSLDEIKEKLVKSSLQSLEIKNVFNARTSQDYALVKLLESASPETKIEYIKTELSSAASGVHPDVFWKLGTEAGYHTHLKWSTDGTDGNFDVTFISSSLKLLLPQGPLSKLPVNAKPADFARTPLSTNELRLSKALIEEWKTNLKKYLPDYMVPSDFVALKSFPLTSNNKIDKKALPKPNIKMDGLLVSDQRPQDNNELIISKIWSSVLGFDDIALDADFFELGGHSLLAVKVMTAIEKQIGKRLPLATLFENSTIEKLAKKIKSKETEKLGALVPIKESGIKNPVYLIHGAGLNILLFKFISSYLDKEQPVYGLQAAGLSKPSPLLYTLEEIAALYISEVIESNPDGPYSLVGYSSGGFIAFEMARQLSAMGKDVSFVGIIDSYAGGMDNLDSRSTIYFKKFVRQFKKIPFILSSLLKYPKETFSYQLNYLKYRLNIRPEHFKKEDEHLSPYEVDIYNSYNTAHRNYILTPSDIKVTLFSVDKRLYYLDDTTYLGWDKFAKKGVKVLRIPGDHITMLSAPNDKKFAEILQYALDSN